MKLRKVVLFFYTNMCYYCNLHNIKIYDIIEIVIEEVDIMVYENENFIVYYNECDKKYISKLLNVLNQRVPYILDFFKINSLNKIIIKLYNNVEEYKKNIVSSFEKSYNNGKDATLRSFKNWMIANTEDGNINLQSLDLVRKLDDFCDYTEEEFCYNVLHEFTHICQQIIGSNSPGWFWETIATILGNPECQHEIESEFTLEDLNKNFDEIDGYGAAYKIGKYLFENYDNSFILELVKDNNKLDKVIKVVIEKINISNKFM